MGIDQKTEFDRKPLVISKAVRRTTQKTRDYEKKNQLSFNSALYTLVF